MPISKTIKRFVLPYSVRSRSSLKASRRLPDDLKATRPEINWRRAAGIGNVLRHEYQTISDKVVWNVVHEDLPALKAAVEAIAKTLEE